MFLNVKTGFSYMTRRGNSPKDVCNFLKLTSFPREGGVSTYDPSAPYYSTGVSLVAQYLESFLFRMKEYTKITDANLNKVHLAAVDLDAELVRNKIIIAQSDQLPSCGSIMNAFINLGYVSHVNGVGYIDKNVADIKYFLYQYQILLVEMRATDGVLNMDKNTPLGYELCANGSIGAVQSDDLTKGFIACGYDNTYLYLQNNLSVRVGSFGFHKIKWSTANNLIVKCCTFNLS